MNPRTAYPLICIAAIAAALLTVAVPARAARWVSGQYGCAAGDDLSASFPGARAPAAGSAWRTRSTCGSRRIR
jgi:hypothetical protein